jgi:hypothetical protein
MRIRVGKSTTAVTLACAMTTEQDDPKDDQDDDIDDSGSSGGRGMHPNSRANLRPPWKPGQPSPNRSGLTKDGRSPRAAKLQEHVEKRLRKGRTMYKLANALVQNALDGSVPHMQELLKRLWPIEQQQSGAQVIVQGVRIEMSPGASKPLPPREIEIESSSSSDAVRDSSESHGGPVAQTGVDPDVRDSQESLDP